MNRWSRLIITVAALALAATYYLPLWHISLDAPQYPEGLGFRIWINKMTGQNPGDLDKINNLNHYIGMKKIHPDSIKELKVMPWIMRGVMMFGLLAAITGRRSWLLIWLILFVLVSIAGFVDYYKWGYDYGHNLDQEHAIIKVPGMSYQPPLIGYKKLLNFTASSWPDTGGMVAIASFLAGLGVFLFELRRKRPAGKVAGATAVIALFLLASCGASGPIPIQYGQDACDYCSMTIADQNFAAELVNHKGKAYKFDSIECLAAYCVKSPTQSDHASLYVTDRNHPGRLVELEKTSLVGTERLRSPMGMGLVAVGSAVAADSVKIAYGGDTLSWDRVKQRVAEDWHVAPGE
ncbi:MAG: nitrous oxide reductase accessory protein NosL [candidate division Zixibacteria bacterium]|nr:nitrous oxide reductase accessory protein NosL [candidate division Zixibacteria bacterium]